MRSKRRMANKSAEEEPMRPLSNKPQYALLVLLAIIVPSFQPVADCAVITLHPSSYKTTRAGDGGQPVANLAVLDQTGSQDNWDKYVELNTPGGISYRGYRSYFLSAGLDPAKIKAIQLKANFRGPVRNVQVWTWSVFDWVDRNWVALGDNIHAQDWIWRFAAFNVNGVLERYVNTLTREIRIQLTSSNARDDFGLDYEALTISDSILPPVPVGQVRHWAYQIQGISAPGAVDRLGASHFDMFVLEPTRTDWSSRDKYFRTKALVARLKRGLASDGTHRPLILAYIDIGEAEDWRWYWKWSKGWDCSTPKPADLPEYIITCDPDGWTGNYPVAYWNPLWKDIVIYGRNQNSYPYGDYTSIIDEVIKDGFDGIYLDWVEAFSNKAVQTAASLAGKDPAVEMIRFIQEMRAYAIARNPNFVIVQQNAADLCEKHPELFDTIDAISQEAIWYDGEATDWWGDPKGHDILNPAWLSKWYVNLLNRYRAAGLPVFNCEYALSNAGSAYTKSYLKGYVPCVTRRSLSRLTTTTPPGY